MLSVSALQSAVSRFTAAFSPSKTCRVRVPSKNGTMFRYDPYACRVLASPVKTPVAAASTAATLENVPAANRALLEILTANAPATTFSRNAPTAAAAPAPQPSTSPVDPAFAAPSSVTRYAYIRFKHDVLAYVAPFRINVNDTVLVEGDRGEDIGTVERITTDKPAFPVPLKVTRKATQRDHELLGAKRQKEEAAIRTTQTLADSLGLGMTIADCEFQLDYGKLTVFFRSKQRYNDFRKLQRGLFREFRCRIWLTESNRHIAAEKPVVAASQ